MIILHENKKLILRPLNTINEVDLMQMEKLDPTQNLPNQTYQTKLNLIKPNLQKLQNNSIEVWQKKPKKLY